MPMNVKMGSVGVGVDIGSSGCITPCDMTMLIKLCRVEVRANIADSMISPYDTTMAIKISRVRSGVKRVSRVGMS